MELAIHPIARPHYDRLSTQRTVSLLLHGPVGVGLTTLARELARRLLCAGCGDGTCADCVRLRAGSHGRLVELGPDEKAKIGIEAVAILRHKLSLHQQQAQAQVVIIDGADTLTVAAQNALLKTLEEPPSGTTIIMTAHAPDLLLPTIRSRVEAQYFASPGQEIVAQYLVAQRGLRPSEAAELARLGGGLPARTLRLADNPASKTLQVQSYAWLDKLTGPSLCLRICAAMEIARDAPILAVLLEALPSWAHVELRRTHDPRVAQATLRVQERLRANVSAKTALEAFAVELPC